MGRSLLKVEESGTRLSVDTSVNTETESQEEIALIGSILAGERSKFDRLVETYQKRIYGTMFAMLGNRHDAEDATQDVFLTAFRKLAQFEQRSSFYTWLYRIAFNLAIDRQRRMGRTSRRFVGDESIALAESSEQASSSPMSISIANETVDQVRIALGRLDFDRRNIVILRDIECLDYSEIASILALPIGTVRSRLHRARLELRDIMISMGMNQIVDFDPSVPNSTPSASVDSQGLNKS